MSSRTTTRSAASVQSPVVVLFDGECNLCSGVVRFLIARDPQARFRFAALQSPAARSACAAVGRTLLTESTPGTMVVIEGGRSLERSDAALAIARRMPFPWRLSCLLRVLPRGIRDRLYGSVARNRHRWFGRSSVCMVPTPELRSRFLD